MHITDLTHRSRRCPKTLGFAFQKFRLPLRSGARPIHVSKFDHRPFALKKVNHEMPAERFSRVVPGAITRDNVSAAILIALRVQKRPEIRAKLAYVKILFLMHYQ